MENNHVRNVAEYESCGACPAAPIDVFRNLNPPKRTNFVKICATHHQVARPRKSVLLDVTFLEVCKNAFIGFYCCKPSFVISPDLNITTENSCLRCRAKCPESNAQPFRMRATICVDKSNN